MKLANDYVDLKLNSLIKEYQERNNQKNENDQSSSSRHKEIEKSMKEFKDQYEINQKKKAHQEGDNFNLLAKPEQKITDEEHPNNPSYL